MNRSESAPSLTRPLLPNINNLPQKTNAYPMPLGWMVISISCRDRTVINGLLNVLTSYASFEGFIDKRCSGRVARDSFGQVLRYGRIS
jgi:hypothetical protein